MSYKCTYVLRVSGSTCITYSDLLNNQNKGISMDRVRRFSSLAAPYAPSGNENGGDGSTTDSQTRVGEVYKTNQDAKEQGSPFPTSHDNVCMSQYRNG